MPKEYTYRLLQRAIDAGIKIDDVDLRLTIGDLETMVRHREREMRSLHTDVAAIS